MIKPLYQIPNISGYQEPITFIDNIDGGSFYLATYNAQKVIVKVYPYPGRTASEYVEIKRFYKNFLYEYTDFYEAYEKIKHLLTLI